MTSKTPPKPRTRRRKPPIKQKWHQGITAKLLAANAVIMLLLVSSYSKPVTQNVVAPPVVIREKPALNRWDSQQIYLAMRQHLQEVRGKYNWTYNLDTTTLSNRIKLNQ